MKTNPLAPTKAIGIELVDVVGIQAIPVQGARCRTAAVRLKLEGKDVEFFVSARTTEQLDIAVGRLVNAEHFALNAEHIRSTVLIPEHELKIDDEL